MSKQAGNKKAFTKHACKVILAAVWLAILILCVQNRKYFTVDGVLNLSPHNTALPYYDGALGDTVPIEKAFALGCDKVVLVLTLPVDTVRTAKKDKFLADKIRKTYPLTANRLEHRAGQYNVGIAQAKKYATQGKLLLVAPDDTCGVTTLKRKPAHLAQLYEKGYSDGRKIVSFLSD